MKGFARVFAVSTLSVAFASAAQAQALPAATEVIAKYVDAIGGKDAILKMKSVTQKQVMEIPAAGLTAEMEVHAAAPNKMSARTTLPGIGEMLQGFDGTTGWDINPMQGARVLSGEELAQTADNSDFYGSRLFPADKFKSMETLEQTDFNGEKAYKVRMVRTSGDTLTFFFSSSSALLIGTEAAQTNQMGRMVIQTKLSQYVTVDGIKFPTRTEVQVGPNSIITTTKETVINAVPATAFDVPAAVKAMVGK